MGLIEFKNISIYRREKLIMENFNLKIEKGELYPFIYNNHKDLAYIFRYLLGLRGSVEGKIINHESLENYDLKDSTAFLPCSGGIYPWMRVREHLEFFESIFDDISREKSEDC